MKDIQYEIEVNGRLRQVAVRRVNGAFLVSVDGRQWLIDLARVDAQTLSLLISSESGQPDGAAPASSHEVTLAPDVRTGALVVHVGEVPIAVSVNGRRRHGRTDESAPLGSGPERLTAPMPGKIVRVLVKTGEAVSARQPLVVIEAMKMENELRASQAGTVAEIHVRDGQSVDAGTLLAVIHR
jgi:glutaconyl-CoA/methylmalonyl-CoA decarboxylase subunit gamma